MYFRKAHTVQPTLPSFIFEKKKKYIPNICVGIHFLFEILLDGLEKSCLKKSSLREDKYLRQQLNEKRVFFLLGNRPIALILTKAG